MKILVPALGRINIHNRDGGEIRLIEISKILLKKGFLLYFILPPREKKLFKSEGLHAKFQLLPEKITYKKENLLLILIIYFFRLIKALFIKPPVNVNLIYIPSDFLIDLLPGLFWKRRSPKAKIIVCLFLLAPNPFRQPFSLRSLLFYLSQKLSLFIMKYFVDKVLVLNNQDKKLLLRHGFGKKVIVVNMGVDYKNYHSYANQKKVYDGCFIGRLHRQKGITDLIPIWKKVIYLKPTAKLAIITGGDQNLQNQLQKKALQAKLSKNIYFMGFKTGREKMKILGQSRVCLFPSYYEGWGMVAVEAMAAGLPVVAYNLPIFKEIFPQGLLTCPLGNKLALAKLVVKLLSNDKYLSHVSKQACKQAQVYDWSKTVSLEIQIFKKLN